MTQPATYNRQASFTNIQAAGPTAPLPGNTIDAEYNAIKTTLDQTLQNLLLIQRDDGSLANKSVGKDQLAPEIAIGFNAPQPWAQSTSYTSSPQSTVFYQSQFFGCITSHLSGAVFDSTKWRLIADFSSIAIAAAANVALTPAGNIASTNVQAALYELDAEKSLVGHQHPSTDITDSTSAGRAFLTAASVAAQIALLGITNASAAPGDIKDTAAITLQTGWLWCDGASYLRTDQPALFAAITISTTGNTTNASAVVSNIPSTADMRAGMPITGVNISNATTILTVDSATQITMSANATGTTTAGALQVCPHGAADVTHFNVPDYKDRLRAGRGDMGAGGDAARITTAGSGVDGKRLGAAAGVQNITLAQANLPNVTLVVTGTIKDQRTNTDTLSGADGAGAGDNFVRSNAGAANTHQLTFNNGLTASINGNVTQTTVNNMPPVGICNTIIKT